MSALLMGIASYVYIKNASDDIIGAAVKLDDKILSGEDFSREYEELHRLCEKHLPYFSVILKHSDADVIKKSFINLRYAVKNNDTERISVILSELIAFIYVTAEGERPAAENIF